MFKVATLVSLGFRPNDAVDVVFDSPEYLETVQDPIVIPPYSACHVELQGFVQSRLSATLIVYEEVLKSLSCRSITHRESTKSLVHMEVFNRLKLNPLGSFSALDSLVGLILECGGVLAQYPVFAAVQGAVAGRVCDCQSCASEYGHLSLPLVLHQWLYGKLVLCSRCPESSRTVIFRDIQEHVDNRLIPGMPENFTFKNVRWWFFYAGRLGFLSALSDNAMFRDIYQKMHMTPCPTLTKRQARELYESDSLEPFLKLALLNAYLAGDSAESTADVLRLGGLVEVNVDAVRGWFEEAKDRQYEMHMVDEPLFFSAMVEDYVQVSSLNYRD